MRVVWKDSVKRKIYTYRNHSIQRYKNGWITDVPGDDNIYQTAEMAHNAIDKILGGHGNKINRGRLRLGIKVVGKKDGEKSCG